jgi:peptide deformylase
MAILEIITADTDHKDVLRQVAKPMPLEDIPGYQKLIDDMIETTHSIGAIGLAAPQVGYSVQLFVLEDGTVAINPGRVTGSGKITSHMEGCLSVPDKRFKIKRIRNARLRCLDRDGKPQLLKPRKKLYSVAIQHEVDHLNGKLVCDRGTEVS